ncbi:DUF1566 domain-containing protein [bacterium]|nr:DUF1566 domain-containing protein [bacterium]
MDLDLGSSTSNVEVAATKTLIIGDTLYTTAGTTLNVTGAGTFSLHDVSLGADLDIDGPVRLSPDSTLIVTANATFGSGSNLQFNDGLIVATGAALVINDTDGTYMVSFAGGITITGTGTVEVAGDESLDMIYDNLDATTLAKITDSSSGTVSPTQTDPKEILAFRATPGDASIGLSWTIQAGTNGDIMIRRDTVGFPATESAGDLVYNGSGVGGTHNDTNTNKIVNGTKYYYSAFSHNGGANYSTGVNVLACATIEPTSIVGYYQFSGSSNVDDSSGKGAHGDLFSATSTTDLNGIANQAMSFSGTDNFVEIDNPLSNSFTIAFWLKSSQVAGSDTGEWFDGMSLIDGKIGDDQNDFGVSLGAGKVLFGTGNAGADTTIKSTGTLNDNNWHHVAVSRDFASGNMVLFVDGQENATGTMAGSITLNSPNFLRFGSTPLYENFYAGSIDEVRLYGAVLTAVQVHRLYANLLSQIVPDTGQTASYTATVGEDNDYTANVPVYTDNGDGTITDNVTNLMWEQVDDNTTRDWTTAQSYCTSLTLATHTDWRLPNIRELTQIADYGNNGPSINALFTGTDNADYWSNTANAINTSNAWAVDFNLGISAGASDKAGSSYVVRCVRGAETTASTYSNNANVVTDLKTGLVWQRDDNPGVDTWENALTYCEGLVMDGDNDWRLPNVKEILSIVEYTANAAPTINTTYFNGTDNAAYWSSTTKTDATTFAWTVGFDTGQMGSSDKTGALNIRCVREGL